MPSIVRVIDRADEIISAGSAGQLQYHGGTYIGGAAAAVYQATTPHLALTAQAAGIVPLQIKGAVSQTANLQEWQNSSGNVMCIDSRGVIGLGGNPSSQTRAIQISDSINSISADMREEYSSIVFSAPCSSSYYSYYGKLVDISTPAGSTSYSKLTANGIYSKVTHNGSGGLSQVRGLWMAAFNKGGGTITTLEGARYQAQNKYGTITSQGALIILNNVLAYGAGNAVSSTIYGVKSTIQIGAMGGLSASSTNAYGFYSEYSGMLDGAGAASITNLYHYYVAPENVLLGSPTIGTQYGLYISSMDYAAVNYAIYTNAGLVRFGGNLFLAAVKSGADQAAAGAAAGEVWRTSGHATLPDNVLMIGV